MPLIAWAGTGNDRLEGGDHSSIFFGGSGNDTLIGHSLVDHLFAGSGHNQLVYQPHWDLLAFFGDLPWLLDAGLSLERCGFRA